MLVSSLKIQRQGKIPSKTVLFTILSQGRKKKKKKYFTKKQSRKTVSYSQELIAFTKKKKGKKSEMTFSKMQIVAEGDK